jgi:hypothetical protein
LLDYIKKMQSLGYRVDCTKTKRFNIMEEFMGNFAPIKNVDNYLSYINLHIDSLNNILKNNGMLIFAPELLGAKEITSIKDDLIVSTNIKNSLFLTFDCKSKNFSLLSAPFSKPILVFLNYTKETQMCRVDSIRGEHQIIKIPKSNLIF